MTEEEEEAYAADIEKMSPPQRARYELNQVTDRVFAPLSAGERSQTARLKTLWERSQQEFKTGDLTDGNAQTIAELIKMLHGYDQERALFEDRYRNMDHVEDSGLAKGLSAEQKKEFSGNEISRQWKDWVSIHRPKVQRLLSSLSE